MPHSQSPYAGSPTFSFLTRLVNRLALPAYGRCRTVALCRVGRKLSGERSASALLSVVVIAFMYEDTNSPM